MTTTGDGLAMKGVSTYYAHFALGPNFSVPVSAIYSTLACRTNTATRGGGGGGDEQNQCERESTAAGRLYTSTSFFPVSRALRLLLLLQEKRIGAATKIVFPDGCSNTRRAVGL